MDRRDFCWTGLAGLTGLALGGAAPLGRAAEPMDRVGPPHFKFSLAAYSYRGLLQAGDMTLEEFIDDCARFGLDGTELTSYYFPAEVTPEYLRKLRMHAFRRGLDVSGTAVGNDFGSPEGEPRKKQIAHVKRWVDFAALLSAPVIRIFAGHQKKGVSAEESHRLMVAGMEACCAYAGERGVFLALENHGGPTATADGLLKLVRDVDSPYLGVNLDTGNFHTEDVYGDLARCAPYAMNVQVKVVIRGANGVRKPTDYTRLAKILRDAGYQGYVALEYEEKGDPRKACREELDKLREGFA